VTRKGQFLEVVKKKKKNFIWTTDYLKKKNKIKRGDTCRSVASSDETSFHMYFFKSICNNSIVPHPRDGSNTHYNNTRCPSEKKMVTRCKMTCITFLINRMSCPHLSRQRHERYEGHGVFEKGLALLSHSVIWSKSDKE
jgi:hypothetical protein